MNASGPKCDGSGLGSPLPSPGCLRAARRQTHASHHSRLILLLSARRELTPALSQLCNLALEILATAADGGRDGAARRALLASSLPASCAWLLPQPLPGGPYSPTV